MKTFLSIFEVLGIPLSLKKTVGQFNTIEYLGIYLDSDKMEYSYLMGVDAIDQSICPEVLGMTKCSIA
jgi:hypothetical protein